MCDRWSTFENFLADMGERPVGTSIDRQDNTRGYEPGNCRWATRNEQNRNTRHVKLTAVDVMQIRWLVAEGKCTTAAVARAFDVTGTHVRYIVKGRVWQ